MQKKPSKLTLNKETLRNLDDHELDQVAGGLTGCICLTDCTRPCTECTSACSICCL